MDRRRFVITSVAAMSVGFSTRLGLGAEAAPREAPRPRSRAHVYLLRGLFGVSQGMDQLADKLRRRGIRATVHGHGEASALAAQAASNYKNGSERTIILVGHSLGGGAALAMATELNRASVPVALVVPIDPVGAIAAPPNVRRVINFYVSDGMGSAIARTAGFRGHLRNLDFKGRADGGHMAIQRSERVHQQIIGYVLAVT
jgi:pimeloyl-ACP methyl ester carboxylesterase